MGDMMRGGVGQWKRGRRGEAGTEGQGGCREAVRG